MFDIGKTYVRHELHAEFGGQQQGGISTPAAHPIIFLFTGSGGEEWGYRDEWEADGTFRYSGEGQQGNMQFVRGNLAVRDHAGNGKDLHLFDADGRGHARYVGQMVCAGYDLVPNVPDGDGHPRTAIVFRLVPIEDLGGIVTPPIPDKTDLAHPPTWYWSADLDELRKAAMEGTPKTSVAKDSRRKVHHRSEAVKVYVQRRAAGKCEGCLTPAPFKTPAGRPYLEPHHTRRLSDGGPDHPAWVVAVCPVCHRRAHHADDAKAFNDGLMALANRLESLKPTKPMRA